MQGYTQLGTDWTRDTRNEENRMFKELYDQVGNVVQEITEEVINQIIDDSRLNWLPSFVDTYEDIATTYPNPSEGDTTMQRNDSADYPVDENDKREAGTIWRFDGTVWEPVMGINPSAITGLETTINAKIGDLDSFRTIDTDIMSKMANEFTERGVNVKWFGASGSDQQTTGTIATDSNELTVTDSIDFKVGHGILVSGAGDSGIALVTSITSINGNTITLADNASISVTDAVVQHDDSLAINDALSYSGDVIFNSGVYLITQQLTATITKSTNLKANGEVVLRHNGTNNGYILKINANKFDIQLIGDFVFDGNNTAARGLIIDNSTSVMDDAITFYSSDLKLRNFYSTTEGVGSFGARLKGGFNVVEFDRVICENVSRAQGVGIPFSQGSIGIQVTHDGVGAYAKQVIFNNPIIREITSDELDGDPNNVDCDGLSVFSPNDNNASSSIIVVNGGEFSDCRGRSIKSQMGNSQINGTSFVRRNIKSMGNACEIDVQRGLGIIKDINCRFYPMGDASSPLGDSYTVITGNHITADYKGNMIIENVQIIADVTDYQFYFCVFDASQQMSLFKIKGVSLLSGFDANLHSLLRCDVSKIDNVIVENNTINRVINGIVSDLTPSGTTITSKIILRDNFQYHGTQPELIHNKQNSYANGIFIIENNIGFVTPAEYQDEIFFGVKENAQINTRAIRLTTSGLAMSPTGQLVNGQWNLVGDNQNYGVKILMVRENFNPQGVYSVMPVGSGIVDTGTNTLYIHMGNGVWGSTSLTVPS